MLDVEYFLTFLFTISLFLVMSTMRRFISLIVLRAMTFVFPATAEKGKYECYLKDICFDIFKDLDKLLDSLPKDKVKKCIAYAIQDGYDDLPLNLNTYISSDPEFEATVFLEYEE